jgi:energy-coupling factor transporter transmembrane protein EcfT
MVKSKLNSRAKWMIIGLILIFQTFVSFQIASGFTIGEFIKYCCLAGIYICSIIVLITFWLAIVKKAAWKEFVLYLISLLIALSALGYAIVRGQRPTHVELQPPSNVHNNYRPKK